MIVNCAPWQALGRKPPRPSHNRRSSYETNTCSPVDRVSNGGNFNVTCMLLELREWRGMLG
jgi:hypothetical protein